MLFQTSRKKFLATRANGCLFFLKIQFFYAVSDISEEMPDDTCKWLAAWFAAHSGTLNETKTNPKPN
jgi:hypothetical protein